MNKTPSTPTMMVEWPKMKISSNTNMTPSTKSPTVSQPASPAK